jgi:threonine dehydratase
MAAEVFVPADVNPVHLARIKSFGAAVTVGGTDFERAKQQARQHATKHPDWVFIEDGEAPAISEGAGTIAIELLRAGHLDTVVLPVGDGALITGIALWMKRHSPDTRIVGVCATGAPAMAESWRAGKPISTERIDTIADGLAVRVPVAKSLERMKDLVDDIVLVDDSQLITAMRLAIATLGILLEPSGAAGLAAIRAHSLPGDRFATVLTGGNLHPDLISRLLRSRGRQR